MSAYPLLRSMGSAVVRFAALAALLAGCPSAGSVRSAPQGRPAAPATENGGAVGGATPATSRGSTVRARAIDRSAEVELYFARQVEAKRRVDQVFATVLGGEIIVRKIAYDGADGLAIPAYLFVGRHTTAARPVILFVHGGIHGDFGLVHLEQVRDLVARGYLVVAPEYRGSTGYGRRFYELIDYGGKEIDDVIAARDYLARHAPYADLGRAAVMGYSHGGFIALHAVMRRPELFRAAVAHVPVADLPTRMRTHSPEYEALFVAQPAYGATLRENPRPYIERSPSTHARSLRTPVLVHTADNDDDVFIAENRILRDSMVAAGMDTLGLYTYREWRSPPGGHAFGVMDTPEGRESWSETLAFLAKHLAPPPARQ